MILLVESLLNSLASVAICSAALHLIIIMQIITVIDLWLDNNALIFKNIRGRSQLSTFMKVYTAYARGEWVWDHRTLSPRKSTFIFNH